MFRPTNNDVRRRLGAVSTLFILMLLVQGLPQRGAAQGRPPGKCAVKGLVPIRQYVRAAESTCFASAVHAENAGFSSFSAETAASRKRRRCSVTAVPAAGVCFSAQEVRCFRSERRARRRGFTHLTPAGADPTPSPAPSPAVTPTAAPTVPPISDVGVELAFTLSPYTAGSGYSGGCLALIGSNRTTLTLQCSHNVPAATEAHIHLIPDNEKFCVLADPALDFTYSCSLTPQEAAGIDAGVALLSIHVGIGGENQVLTGYIRPE